MPIPSAPLPMWFAARPAPAVPGDGGSTPTQDSTGVSVGGAPWSRGIGALVMALSGPAAAALRTLLGKPAGTRRRRSPEN